PPPDEDLDEELDAMYGDEPEATDDDEAAQPESHDEEGLAALAPPFGNEPPRVRRPPSLPPEEPPDDEEVAPEIRALPVMSIGESAEEAPPSEPRRRRCHHCGHKLLPEERFCGMCGVRTRQELDPSVPVCDACGTEIVEDTRF